MRVIAVLCALLAAVGCAGPRVGGVRVANLNKWYIATELQFQRAPVPIEQVAFFEKAPQDRSYKVIGHIAPHPEAFDTYPEFVNAIRAAGSLHGADAVFIDSQDVQQSWNFRFNSWGGGGGVQRHVIIRAKAIIWDK